VLVAVPQQVVERSRSQVELTADQGRPRRGAVVPARFEAGSATLILAVPAFKRPPAGPVGWRPRVYQPR